MIVSGIASLLSALALPPQAAVAPGPDSALIAEARANPGAVRDAIGEEFARAVRQSGDLSRAEVLAHAYALAWADSFLLREVSRFAAWPAERRAGKVWADSVRRAGIDAFRRDGAAAALVLWRRALARSALVADTAGMAAVLGNMGAAFSVDGPLDSAETYLRQAATMAAAVGNVAVEANAAVTLGDVRQTRGDLEGARTAYARAVRLHTSVGDRRGLAADHNSLGLLAQELGDRREARRQFEAALALNRADGRERSSATNLVNLAGLASQEGDFSKAAADYRDALAVWERHGDWADAADALYGLGLVELRRGDYPAAERHLTAALEIFDRTGPPERIIAVRRALADALGAQGDLQGAVDALRRAQDFADSTGSSPGIRATLTLARADLALRLNALADAEELYDAAAVLYRRAVDPLGEADAQTGRAALLIERGDLIGAHALLDAALRTQLDAGDVRGAALTRLAAARVAADRGDTALARGTLDEAVGELQRVGDPVAAAAAWLQRGQLEQAAGLPTVAASYYRRGIVALADRTAPDVTWQLRFGLALALREQGDADGAVRELREAIRAIERGAGSLYLPERRSGYLADKWDAYAALVFTEHARGRADAAFDASERMRARAMLESLDRGRVAPAPGVSATLVAQEQDLRRRITELTRRLDRSAVGAEALRGPDVSLASGATLEALLDAQDRYELLLLDMKERAPRHAALVAPTPAPWREVAARLAPDQALIEYVVGDSGSLALVVTRNFVRTVHLGAGRRELSRLIEFVRGTLEPSSGSAGDDLWRGPLRRLHRYLIEPVEHDGLLDGVTRLVLVPHAELHYLPFPALLGGADADRYLVERYELAFAPSASVWLALGRRDRATGTGVLAFAPQPERLPGSRREVERLAARVEGTTVLTGRSATEAAFRDRAGARRVLHLATYGVLNKPNPLFSFVELSPGGGHDGKLEVHEVFGLDLTAELVVLSACQTALGSGALADVPAGDDWVSLSRAFLHAGAASVVATLWPVEDRASAALMERFYDDFRAGSDPARLLTAAQRRMIANGATAHPFAWAGFVAIEGAEPPKAP